MFHLKLGVQVLLTVEHVKTVSIVNIVTVEALAVFAEREVAQKVIQTLIKATQRNHKPNKLFLTDVRPIVYC
nr:hypothetical protein BACT7_22260 [Tenacibaculum mesophilum]